MAVKIYISGNALIVEDDSTGAIIKDALKNLIYYDSIKLERDSKVQLVVYDSIKNIYPSWHTSDLSLVKNELGVLYNKTTFRQFCNLNLGKLSSEPQLPSQLKNRVIVRLASDFGVIDSDKEYFIDGIVDMAGAFIEVPSGGISMAGYNPEISKIIDSTNSYTMFKSPVGGSGNFIMDRVGIEVTGAGSQVYDLVGDTGLEVIELTGVNYNNCTSRGEINGFRQGLESITGYFGGKPQLTLSGIWSGGYFIDVSLVRSLDDGVYSLFSSGSGLSMASRFRTNQNIDLPASASFFDFQPSDFTNPSTVVIEQVIISRNGVFNSGDTNITPNMQASDLSSSWSRNKGMNNTFEGGESRITTEITTTITSSGVFFDLAGVYTASDLQHFDSPSNGQMRYLGDSPIEYKVSVFGIIDGGANDEVELKITLWDDSASAFVDYKTVVRVINNFQGGRDVAYFNFTDYVIFNTNDYVKLMVANISDTTNVTAELDTEYIIELR